MYRLIKIISFTVFIFIILSLLLLFSPNLNLHKETLIIVHPNSYSTVIADDLGSHGLIYSRRVFLYYAKLTGVAHKLRAGYYLLKPHESAYSILQKMVIGAHPVTHITIVPGSTTDDVNESVKNNRFIVYVPLAKNKIGLLLPETYQLEYGDSAEKLYAMAEAQLSLYLNQLWQNRDKRIPIRKSYDLIKVASIIEKEGYHQNDLPKIASVIYNRLNIWLELSMCSTMAYGLGVKKIKASDLRQDHPYNTYRYYGLPPTPIAFPSKASFEAAAHPAYLDNLYFLSKDRNLYFSKTRKEHEVLIKKHLQ